MLFFPCDFSRLGWHVLGKACMRWLRCKAGLFPCPIPVEQLGILYLKVGLVPSPARKFCRCRGPRWASECQVSGSPEAMHKGGPGGIFPPRAQELLARSQRSRCLGLAYKAGLCPCAPSHTASGNGVTLVNFAWLAVPPGRYAQAQPLGVISRS